MTYILLNGAGYVLDLLTQKGVPFIGPSEILLDREVRVGLQPAVSQVVIQCHEHPQSQKQFPLPLPI